jgi:hypothetical protein
VELLYKDGCRTEGKILSRRDHPKKKSRAPSSSNTEKERGEWTTSQKKRRARQVRKVREFLQESKKNTSVVFF